MINYPINSDVILKKEGKRRKWKGEKKRHQHLHLNTMRPVTRISVPLERNQKENTQFRKGGNIPKNKGKCRKKTIAKWGNNGHQFVDINKTLTSLFLFVYFQHAV